MKKVAYIVDGASSGNGRSGGIGVVCKDIETRKVIETLSESAGAITNNEAEYQAVIEALRLAKNLVGKNEDLKEILVLSDSELIVRQLNEEWKIKTSDLKGLAQEVWGLVEEFPKNVVITFDQVPREYTHEADELARIASEKGREIEIESKYPFLKKQ